MIKFESRLNIINADIQRLEAIVTASKEEQDSALLNQLRKLREDIKTKAKKDYIMVQNEVMQSFKKLMEQLTTLSFFASEAEEDIRPLEKAISSMNKIKTMVSENILGLQKEEEKVQSSADPDIEASVDDDMKNYIEQSNGMFYTNYASWFTDVMGRGHHIDIDGYTVEALDKDENCLGKFDTSEMKGCLFNNIEDYDRAFEGKTDEEIEEDDEEAIEEDDDE